MDRFDEWSASLRAAEQALVPGQILQLQKKLAFLTLGAAVELAPGRFRRVSGVVLLTPVDTGRARSSWSVSVGTQPTGGLNNGTVEGATSAMRSLGVYQAVWIVSNLPYIKALEYGGYPQSPKRGSWDRRTHQWVIKSSGGFSRQAPRGMVRITVSAIKAALGAG